MILILSALIRESSILIFSVLTWGVGEKHKSWFKEYSRWLKASRLCLNIKKTELIIFRPHTKKLDHSFQIKLNGKRLIPAHSVKYLGVLLDEHLK